MTIETGPGPDRFAFGDNWRRFLSDLTPSRIDEAERSLTEMLGPDDLRGRRLLDIGSGSGLFSLAAVRLGAQVVSFDYDAESVACTEHLRSEYAPGADWQVGCGSVLDRDFVSSLGQFDIVYSWGVLHHTGDMASAMANAAGPVMQGGLLFIALYNDQGRASRAWGAVKKAYVAGPRPIRAALLAASGALLWSPALVRGIRHGEPLREWRMYQGLRGMSMRHDLVDWVGGYPFEVATPGYVFDFYRERGFELERLVTRTGLGCNEYVFRRGAG